MATVGPWFATWIQDAYLFDMRPTCHRAAIFPKQPWAISSCATHTDQSRPNCCGLSELSSIQLRSVTGHRVPLTIHNMPAGCPVSRYLCGPCCVTCTRGFSHCAACLCFNKLSGEKKPVRFFASIWAPGAPQRLGRLRADDRNLKLEAACLPPHLISILRAVDFNVPVFCKRSVRTPLSRRLPAGGSRA